MHKNYLHSLIIYMKKKKLCLTIIGILFMLLNLEVKAQQYVSPSYISQTDQLDQIIKLTDENDWAPIGAEWHYSFSDIYETGYVKIESVADTIIDGFSCRKLYKSKHFYSFLHNEYFIVDIGSEFTKSDENKVYIYRNGVFYTLYDFNAGIGDSLIVPQTYQTDCDTVGFVIVVDKGIDILNGFSLRYIKVIKPDSSDWGFLGDTVKIIERLGPLNSYLLPEQHCIIDGGTEGGELRCYSDSEFGNYTVDIVPYCDYILSINDKTLGKELVNISPNPVRSIIKVEVPYDYLDAEIFIFDMYGNKVFLSTLNGLCAEINVADLKNGLYHIVIKKEEKIYFYKLIKFY